MKDYKDKSWEELVSVAERAATTLDIISAFVNARKNYRMGDAEFYSAVETVISAVQKDDCDG